MISPVPLDVSIEGKKVSLDDLEACHCLKKKENIIIKFKSRKLKYNEEQIQRVG